MLRLVGVKSCVLERILVFFFFVLPLGFWTKLRIRRTMIIPAASRGAQASNVVSAGALCQLHFGFRTSSLVSRSFLG